MPVQEKLMTEEKWPAEKSSTVKSEFPNAPVGWSKSNAQKLARNESLELVDAHWEIIQAIQSYVANHDMEINVRNLLDALDEKFHHLGGSKYLYRLLPGGPVAQGCRLAGVRAPAGSVDRGFGSVQ